jgi:acetylornithine deacetylase/succinyl-diaminopimelate desuccinylase-like protein
MQNIKEYVEANKQRFLDELFDLLRLPSVSADPKFKGDVEKTAEFVAQKLREAGADNVEVCPTAGNPIVYGEKIIDPALPTVLTYGHYDVQPADPYELWDTLLSNRRFVMAKSMHVVLPMIKVSFICM